MFDLCVQGRFVRLKKMRNQSLEVMRGWRGWLEVRGRESRINVFNVKAFRFGMSTA